MAYKFRADRTLSRAFKDFSIGFKANPNTEDFSVVMLNAGKVVTEDEVKTLKDN